MEGCSVAWPTKLVLALALGVVVRTSAQAQSQTLLQNQEIHQQTLPSQQPQVAQVHSIPSSLLDNDYNNYLKNQQPQVAQAPSIATSHHDNYYNNNNNYLGYQDQQVYQLPPLIPHPQSRRRLERQHSRRPANYLASQNDYDTDNGIDSNPLTVLRNWWYETWDGTSRLLDTSYTTYLWAVPLVGVLAYDIMVPERLKVKRSADEEELQTHDNRLHTEALLLRGATLLSALYDEYEEDSRVKSAEHPQLGAKLDLGRLIAELGSGDSGEVTVEQEACVLAARVRERTRNSPDLVVFLKRAIWLLLQTRPTEGALLKGIMEGLRGAHCRTHSTQH